MATLSTAITAIAVEKASTGISVRKLTVCSQVMAAMPPRSGSATVDNDSPMVSRSMRHIMGPIMERVRVAPNKKAAVVNSALFATCPSARVSSSFLLVASSVFSPESDSAMDQRLIAGVGATCTALAKISTLVA